MAGPSESHHPAQEQDRQPGRQAAMQPTPRAEMRDYRGTGRLAGKAALISGGDSGTGRAVAIGFAKEGADVAIVYLEEHEDAEATRAVIEQEGRRCVALAGDIGDEVFCREAVSEVAETFGRLDILVNTRPSNTRRSASRTSARRSWSVPSRPISSACFTSPRPAFRTCGKARRSSTAPRSPAYRGSSHLIDYASTKGAIVSFTRSLAGQLKERKIRVNAVAPGPVWTPLIPASFPAEKVEGFGEQTILGRPLEPDEVAPSWRRTTRSG